MEHTEYYHLPQWEADDRIHHDDFNDAFAAIDTAVAGKAEASAVPKFYHGSYIGDGTATRTITLGFTPKALLIFGHKSESGSFYQSIIYVSQNISRAFMNVSDCLLVRNTTVRIVENGFATGSIDWCNHAGVTVEYIAFG